MTTLTTHIRLLTLAFYLLAVSSCLIAQTFAEGSLLVTDLRPGIVSHESKVNTAHFHYDARSRAFHSLLPYELTPLDGQSTKSFFVSLTGREGSYVPIPIWEERDGRPNVGDFGISYRLDDMDIPHFIIENPNGGSLVSTLSASFLHFRWYTIAESLLQPIDNLRFVFDDIDSLLVWVEKSYETVLSEQVDPEPEQ